MNFLEKSFSIFDLKEIHKDVSYFDEFIDSISKTKEFNLITYSNLGRSFAAFLSDYNLPQIYRKFVTEYNNTIKKEFKQDNDQINDILKALVVFGIPLMDSFYINDLTDLFSKNRFKKESKLEQLFYSSLTNWSDEWTVKRQQPVGSGISDITIELGNEKAAIELKKGAAIGRDIMQVSGYSLNNSGFSPILIAQRIENDVLKLADQMNVSCYVYCLARPVSCDVPEFFVLEKVNDVVLSPKIDEELKEIDFCGGHTIFFFEKTDYIEVFNKSVQQNKKLMNILIDILENKHLISAQK